MQQLEQSMNFRISFRADNSDDDFVMTEDERRKYIDIARKEMNWKIHMITLW